jgi:hypothetical protein
MGESMTNVPARDEGSIDSQTAVVPNSKLKFIFILEKQCEREIHKRMTLFWTS